MSNTMLLFLAFRVAGLLLLLILDAPSWAWGLVFIIIAGDLYGKE